MGSLSAIVIAHFVQNFTLVLLARKYLACISVRLPFCWGGWDTPFCCCNASSPSPQCHHSHWVICGWAVWKSYGLTERYASFCSALWIISSEWGVFVHSHPSGINCVSECCYLKRNFGFGGWVLRLAFFLCSLVRRESSALRSPGTGDSAFLTNVPIIIISTINQTEPLSPTTHPPSPYSCISIWTDGWMPTEWTFSPPVPSSKNDR